MLSNGLISFLKHYNVLWKLILLSKKGEIKLKREIWKSVDIDGIDFVKDYRISSYGRLKCGNRYYSGSISWGYVVYSLTTTEGRKNFLAHRLVGLHFLSKIEDKQEINHRFGVKNLNYYQCLEWSDRYDNIRHSFSYGLNKGRGGVKVVKMDLNFNKIKVGKVSDIWEKDNSTVYRVCNTLGNRLDYDGESRFSTNGFRFMYLEDYKDSNKLKEAKRMCGELIGG